MQLLFRKNNIKFFALVIRIVTWSIYNHATMNPRSTINCISSNENTGGVGWEEVSGNPKKWDIFEIVYPFSDIPLNKEDEFTIHSWCVSHIGAKYDWKAIWQFRPTYTGDRTGDPDAWICSEYCQTGIGQVFAVLLARRIRSPGGLYRLMSKLGMLKKVTPNTK